jgi:2-oxoglutarate ferredoxin oxidoreductase subunit alpha
MAKVNDISILMGGKAGHGIRVATTLIAKLLSRYGYRAFVYDDYPSLIRGGHNFSIVRISEKKILANTKKVDIIVGLDKLTVERHSGELKDEGVLLHDASFDAEGVAVPFKEIVKELKGIPIMRNSAAIGSLARVLGIDWRIVEEVFYKFIPRNTELNLEIARKCYDMVESHFEIERLSQKTLPVISGNEAIALGAVDAGMDAYYAYPMTPSTSILHFLAANSKEFDILVVHPENEIAVMLMALGSAYAGAKTMVASSGGGFSLMVEGLGLSAQSETPVTVVVSQRTGPSTGVPTYTMQSDLHFILNAGHGEFTRFVAAPGDAEEAYYYTGLAMNIAWKLQIPAFILADKHLSESNYSFDNTLYEVREEEAEFWDGTGEYLRYRDSQSGVSSLAFPGDAVVKANSYAHDEYGITTEEAEKIAKMQEKRLRKREVLVNELRKIEQFKIYGSNSDTVVLTWGSTKGAVVEAAEILGLKVVQPIIMEPFPDISGQVKDKRLIAVEVNATGQLARLLECNGIKVEERLLKYNARPFFVDELVERLEVVLQ